METQLGMDLLEAHKQRLLQLNQLDEIKHDAVQYNILVQEQQERLHDKLIKKKKFHQGDWDLLFDSQFKNFKGNLTTRSMGPYEIETLFENGVVKIKTIDDQKASFIVNGHKLCLYHKPTSKEEFTHQI